MEAARSFRTKHPVWAWGLLVLAIAMLAVGRTAWAHPHVWIYATVATKFEEGAIDSLEIGWTFDEMYSSFVIEDYDKNGNGSLDQPELDTMAADSVKSLKDFSYLTYLYIGDQQFTVDAVEGLRTSVVGGLLHYRFTVKLPQKVDPRKTRFDISMYDKEYYIDVQFDGVDAVRLKGPEAGACRPVLTEDVASPIYYGMVYPSLVQIRCDVS